MRVLTCGTEAGMEEENARIARGLGDGDPDVLAWLIDRYQHRLYRYLVFFTRDRQMSDDLFQDTWLRVLERGRQYDPRFRFEGWLLRVARNLAIDQMRRRNPAACDDPDSDEPFDLPDTGRQSAFDAVAAAEDRAALEAAMDRLPAYYREVLTLRFHEGMMLEEIADVVGAPVSTVKSRLRRGLHTLSTLLGRKSP